MLSIKILNLPNNSNKNNKSLIKPKNYSHKISTNQTLKKPYQKNLTIKMKRTNKLKKNSNSDPSKNLEINEKVRPSLITNTSAPIQTVTVVMTLLSHLISISNSNIMVEQKSNDKPMQYIFYIILENDFRCLGKRSLTTKNRNKLSTKFFRSNSSF